MYECFFCGMTTDGGHICPGPRARHSQMLPPLQLLPEPEQDPGYGDIPSRILWHVQQLRKEVAELRRERGPVQAFSAHWAEHD